MGDSESKPEEKPSSTPDKLAVNTGDDDYYIVDSLENISFKNKNSSMFFWVDPKIYNSENKKYEKYLNKYFEIEGLSSVESLQIKMSHYDSSQGFKVICAASLQDEDYRRLSENRHIKALFLFCQNEERATLLRNNFPKILFAKFDIIELKNAIQQNQEQDQSCPKTSLLVLVEEDANLLNQYRINFHSLTCKHPQSRARNDYLKLVEHLFKQQKADFKEFISKYQSLSGADEKRKLIINQALKRGYLWDSISTLPKITTNPKKLAYLRFVFRDLYEAIKKQYNPQSGQVYMVLTPSEEQIRQMTENINNFVIFTSFTKAYTNEKKAYDVFKKTPGSYLVRIMLPILGDHNSISELDFGYFMDEKINQGPNVIFNIYNFFLIEDFEEELREIILIYGSLSEVSYKRQHRRNQYRLNPFEENLMRNYDYLEDLIRNINSQATVLQMSGFFKESLEVHEKMYEGIRKSQPTQSVIDRQIIELGDAYKRDGQFKKAEQYYLRVKKGPQEFKALVHRADLYLCSDQKSKLEKVIAIIQDMIYSNRETDKIEIYRARNFIGMQLIEKKKYLEASKHFKILLDDICEYYDYRYEGIPLVHEIYTNRAACETKLNNYSEAINLLNTTYSWQKICEGSRSRNLQRTQSLIRSLHESRGDILTDDVNTAKSQRKITEKNFMEEKRQNEEDKQRKKLPPGKLPKLGESNINIMTTPDSIQQSRINIMTTPNNIKPINQSSFNIMTTPPVPPKKQIQESKFNIDLS